MNEADRAAAARHRSIWEAFRREPVVTTSRPPLPPSVTATLGFVIPIDDETLCQALRSALLRLEATGCVAPFPEDYWHITIVPPATIAAGEAPPPGHLPTSFIAEALEKGRAAVKGLGPFAVTVRGLNAFRDVLVAVPYDGGRGVELGNIVREAVPELPERYPDGHEPLPHISLAQYARDDRLEEMVGLVERARDTGYGRFRASRLEMFVLSWRDGTPGPVEKHELDLGGGP